MDNPKQLQLLSFCSGYGGIERGLELAGVQFKTIAHVEIEAFAIANLVAKMENNELVPAPIWTNVKTLPLEVFRERVDILTGGYPCQPFSAAGQRKGQEDPRHLWPFILKAIDVIRPRTVFFENVEGHISLGLREVIKSLEGRGYKTTWGIFSASEVGAIHERKRVFIFGTDTKTRGIQRVWSNGCKSKFTLDKEEIFNPLSDGIAPCIEEHQVKFASEMQDLYGDSEILYCQECEEDYAECGCVGPSQDDEYVITENIKWQLKATTKSDIYRKNDANSCWVESIQLLGNGVVPQTAALAWEILNQKLNNK